MSVIKELREKGVKNIENFAKGHRSFVYKGIYNGKEVGIKVEGRFEGKIKNEIKWLKRLNNYKIGPKLLFYGKNYIVYCFVKGELLIDYLKNRKRVKKVLEKIFLKLRILDKLKVDKKEMHHPYKHIFVGKDVKMIDFERCKKSKNPKNVTQFCQFLISSEMSKYVKIDKNKLIEVLKVYKKEQSEENFKKVLSVVFG